MIDDLESIISKLERAQDLMYRGDYSGASTLISEAQSAAQFAKDNKT